MDPALFLADLEEKPRRLRELAGSVRDRDPWAGVVDTLDVPVVLLGMGSSHYANQVAAARLRATGVAAVAELAAADLLPRLTSDTLVVAVSASGGSRETLDAVRRLRADDRGVTYVALSNRESTELGSLCDAVVPMLAGEERGGVACRSFQHTLALFLALEARLTGADVPSLLERCAEATTYLLETRDQWLPDVCDALLGPDGTHVVAPARRLSSALQSALMLREGPRLPAVGCETADWSHVDVYLTRTTDYRMLLFPGSRWEDELLGWVRERGSTLVAVGADVPGAALTVRYPHDDVDDVRLLTETLVAELAAARVWGLTGSPA
ncbi:MAG TPA: SIS domain-containing protein [Nocardioides sp.]|jgi:fructoselysine-6-P-deglycase FrlB-like protein|nr:SIS domain-containing protein [Nocardioides sp.]